MATTATLMTADELLAMPANGFRCDLIRGELRQSELSGYFHSLTGMFLTGPLESDPDTVLAPDIAFVAKANLLDPLPKTGFFVGAPDLAVEVGSPSETMDDVDEKVQNYLDAGTRLVWVLRPLRRRIEFHRINGESIFLSDKEVLSGEEVVPGFALAVNRIFR